MNFDGMNFEDMNADKEKPAQPQFTEAQSRALLSELSPKLREELCQVLRHQQQNTPMEDRPQISNELSRILRRFQRQAAMGFNDQSDEVWPMYFGIALFIIVAFIFFFLYVQEQYAEQDFSDQEDFYWMQREW